MELREYQHDALDALFHYWNREASALPHDNDNKKPFKPIVEMATGTGKSVVIATLCREQVEHYRPNSRVLVLTHVRELVAQNAQAMLRTWPGAPIGINSAGLNRRDTSATILFASVQSVFKKGRELGVFDLVIVDEAHLIPRDGEGMYRSLFVALEENRDDANALRRSQGLEYLPEMRIAGFTATPYRLDSGRLDKGEGSLFDGVAYVYGLGRAVKEGFCSPLISRATATEINVANVGRSGGDFKVGELEAAALDEAVIAGACDEIVTLGADRKSWLVFCSGVKHAEKVCEAMRARGVSCRTVTGETPKGERDYTFQLFKLGSIKCLTGCNVFTTGFDAPAVDLIASMRPTLSTSLYVQMAGRGTRIAEGKANCLYLSYDGNVRRHGPVDEVSVDEKRPGSVKADAIASKICPGCESHVGLATFTCPHCGHEWERPKAEPKHTARAESIPIMASAEPQWIKVSRVDYSHHFSAAGTASMRVEYLCGFSSYSEWVCVKHDGFPRAKAEAWWRAMGGMFPPPRDVADAIRDAQNLEKPSEITVKRDGRYWRVNGYRIARKGMLFELDEKYRGRPVTRQELVA